MIPGCKDKVKTPEERKRAELPPQEGGQPPTSVTNAHAEPPTTVTAQPTVTVSPTLTTSAVPLP